MMRISMFWTMLFCASIASAQDPSGHWVGSVSLPNTEVVTEVDLATSPSGQFVGTLSTPTQKIIGLPLSKIQVNGASVSFAARTDQSFDGTLSADGNTLSGYFAMQDYTFPFVLSRMGRAAIPPQSTSALISKNLEGNWNATFSQNGTQMTVLLKLINRPNGGSSGSLINLDEGSLEIPIARIEENDLNVSLAFKVISASYLARMSDDHSQITGTWLQDGDSSHLSITFTRAKDGR